MWPNIAARCYHLSSDVVENHLLPLVSLPSLIPAILVCKIWRSAFLRSRMMKKQTEIWRSLFKDGECLPLLWWYERYLRYPIFQDNSHLHESMALAAGGSCVDYNEIFLIGIYAKL